MISSEVSTLRVSEPECSCVGGGLMIVWPEWRWKRGGELVTGSRRGREGRRGVSTGLRPALAPQLDISTSQE